MAKDDSNLVFLPLGGLGEIGRNAALYGYGPKKNREWILVDCGVSFAGPEAPGVDLYLPDLRFIEAQKDRLKGIIITHAHEDHIGAVMDLWPRLKAPLYATQFAADLLEVRRFSEPGAKPIPVNIVAPGERFDCGPFNIEMIRVAHSIPESTALALRTPSGLIVHTGDWKIDPTPVVGWTTDEARFRALGDEGVLALVCDSTNVNRDGISPSEADVSVALKEIIGKAKARVAVTTFASNVARIRSVAEAAFANDREVVVVGRAMDRVIQVSRELGLLDGLPPFKTADAFSYLPRHKIVLLMTGSQGEPRAAMARVAEEQHPAIALAPGDTAIFSSRTIPGNEKAVGKIINNLTRMGIDVITDRDGLVHVSGHPRRGELEQMYAWVRPQTAIPAHGEPYHLHEHAKLARKLGVPNVLEVTDGELVALSPGTPAIIDEIGASHLNKDGTIITDASDPAVQERRRLSFSGIISIALALDSRGELAGTPTFDISGLPERASNGQMFDAIIEDAISETLDGLPRGKRRDPESVETAVERAVRGTVAERWGKKPVCHVLVVIV
ncbi:MAG: ribonuclease J [Beijerinckiaceae bacterium]|nr:ribonuclease J [Beijerinckiaceae bacterium]